MAIFTHGVEKPFYELNFSNKNKFCNVFLNTVDERSLRCYCYIQNFQVWETITVLISIFPTTLVFAEKYDDRRLQKKRKNQCFICDDITRFEWDTWLKNIQ